LIIHKESYLQNTTTLNRKGKIIVIGNGYQISVFVLVFDCHFIVSFQFTFEYSLHHQDKFIIGDLLIMDGHSTCIMAQGCLDDDLAGQIEA